MIKENDFYYLEIDDFETIINQLINAKEEYSEDIPPIETRYEGRLESILQQIQSKYFGIDLYPEIETKAAWLFYLLIKNHPLQNGNKRVAVIAYLVFLATNCDELYFDEVSINNELYEIATITAASLPIEQDEIISMLITKSKQYIFFRNE